MTDVGLGPGGVHPAPSSDSTHHPGRGGFAGWTVDVCHNGTALAGLAGEWKDLYSRCPSATPFQAHPWLMSWWRSYGGRGRLRTVLVRRHGRLVAAAPLVGVWRWGFPVLMPLAGPQSDYGDVLIDPEEAGRATWYLARALLHLPGWSAIDFREVRPGSAAHALAEDWPGTAWAIPASTCLELPTGDMGTLLARLPGRKAGKVRARLRRIDANGISVAQVPAENAEVGVARLLDLHLRQWRGRPVNLEHTRPRFRRHLATALADMTRDGHAALFEYRYQNRLAASDLVLIGHDVVGAYLYGASPELRGMVDVTLLLLRQDLAVATRAGVPVLSMLRGDEPYKRKWRPVPVRNERLILGRTPAASLYAAGARYRAELSTARQHQGNSRASGE